MKVMKVRIKLTTECLGTNPADKDIFSEFIASNAPDAKSRKEEIEEIGAQEYEEKSVTVHAKDKDGKPFLWDYQLKGFFKSAAAAGSYQGGSAKLPAYKKKIDLNVHVFAKDDESDRKLMFHLPPNSKMGWCVRPLRAQTMQGERVALAKSETVPAGTWFECQIHILDDSLEKFVRQWLDYGKYNGLLQWRNSGKGRFIWEETE
jgi:hypothetical protein